MNKIEIATLFIKAAIVDRRLPIQARPARLKGSWVPFTHSQADMRLWIRRNELSCQLQPNDDPIEEWFGKFFDEDNQRLKTEDIAIWEQANELIKLVADEGNRRALFHWAIAKAGGKEFSKWCRSEGIHEMTGSRRKDRAIVVIEQYLIRGTSPNTETDGFGVLPVGPVFEHISDNIAADAPNRRDRFVERDADTVFCKEGTVFNWRDMRKAEAQRRSELRRRQAA
ncbi:hypothetical protein RHSP_31866 [Rhizobium freirei PRF 81]|uniref:Uncharacterized protein n=1 Tax=Rhizobium freirei PRF 81 TaxID=363754 RepID=N6V4X0_9HYPH|nr:hypothetical protein [Rhizobium freirei]ENN86052.1 hypothetical protein RHSP_31866 [Rhizobium freirei PRF 81]